MKLAELRKIYARIYGAVARKSQMRSVVFYPGHPKRTAKLQEIENLLADIDLIKDELKRRIELAQSVAPVQSTLLDVPDRRDEFGAVASPMAGDGSGPPSHRRGDCI